MLGQRVLFGGLMIVALVGLAALDDYLAYRIAQDWPPGLMADVGRCLLNGFVLTALVAALVVPATLELARLMRAAGHAPVVWLAAVVNAGLVAVPWLAANGVLAGGRAGSAADFRITAAWLTVAFLAAPAVVIARRRTAGSIAAVGTTMLMVLWCGFLAAYVVRMRVWGGSAWLVLYFLLVCKSCDIGAYFTGLATGRHKLIPWLSPNKTWEGLAGGVAAAVLVATGAAYLVYSLGPARFEGWMPRAGGAAWFGLAMALVGQAGDLVESLFKRDAGAKDSGAVVPAFGGVLDIVDSPLLAAPVAWWLLVQ